MPELKCQKRASAAVLTLYTLTAGAIYPDATGLGDRSGALAVCKAAGCAYSCSRPRKTSLIAVPWKPKFRRITFSMYRR